MAATLKDLAPAEKQKVARLIQQVVEKERAIKDLEAALAGAEAAAAAGGGDDGRAAALEEQNRELARENTRWMLVAGSPAAGGQGPGGGMRSCTGARSPPLGSRLFLTLPTPAPCPRSLRAKLSHAFELLRTYQHKCRVLDATVAVTAGPLAGSRPVTPLSNCELPAALDYAAEQQQQLAACPAADSDGSRREEPQQAADRLRLLHHDGGSRGDTAMGSAASCCDQPCTPLHANGGQGCLGAAVAAETEGWGGGTLSPVAEGACEGPTPARQAPDQQQERQQSGAGSYDSGTQAQRAEPNGAAPQAALPQLETLKLLARALLEAQAEVAAQLPQRQPQRQDSHAGPAPPCALASSSTEASQPCIPAPQSSAAAATPVGQLVYDAFLGPCGGYLISPSAGSAGGEARAPPLPAAAGRPPLAERQQQDGTARASACSMGVGPAPGEERPTAWRPAGCHSGRGGGWPEPDFDQSLMDLVDDVENMMQGAAWSAADGLGSGRLGGSGAAPAGLAGSGECGGGGSSCALYEENDLLSLIHQL